MHLFWSIKLFGMPLVGAFPGDSQPAGTVNFQIRADYSLTKSFVDTSTERRMAGLLPSPRLTTTPSSFNL
jgi:hypothetical protein